jgi:hypothetical protein
MSKRTGFYDRWPSWREKPRAYLGRQRVKAGTASLRDWKPQPYPEGDEHSSKEIDATVSRSGAVIVLDSSFRIAFHNERDPHRNRAVDGMRDFLGGRLPALVGLPGQGSRSHPSPWPKPQYF